MTPKSLSNMFFGVLIVFCLVQYGSQTAQDGCPTFTVKRNQILRTKYSMRMGAKYIKTRVVEKAIECYKSCCDMWNCNLALLQYKNVSGSDGGIRRTCYLFDCGNPSKCSYAPLKHHAAIVFQYRREDLVGGKEDVDGLVPLTTTTRPTTKSLAEELNCPPDAPVAMCLKDPCQGTVCSAYPSATCRPSYCGGCFAHFYDDLDERVSCKVIKPTTPPKSKEEEDLENKQKQTHHQHEKKPASISDSFRNELHKMQNSLHSGHKTFNTYDIDDSPSGKKSKSHLDHQKERENVERKLEEISPHHEKPVEEEELDHEQRVWPDNNPNYPDPPHKKTDEPLDHEQRQWPDNNPNFVRPKPTTIRVTTKPTTKLTTKPTTVPAPKVIPKTVPKPTPRQTPQPVVIIDKGGSRKIEGPHQMNVTMVIEDNRVHFVENKAVLPLAIFLVIAILLLFVVALRLRIIKSKLKRRPFATEDADYLINGMYL